MIFFIFFLKRLLVPALIRANAGDVGSTRGIGMIFINDDVRF